MEAYITDHDATEVYLIRPPDAGGVALWVLTIYIPGIAAQVTAWVRPEGTCGNLYGIDREFIKIVEMQAALQAREWDIPVQVGERYCPGNFVSTADGVKDGEGSRVAVVQPRLPEFILVHRNHTGPILVRICDVNPCLCDC